MVIDILIRRSSIRLSTLIVWYKYFVKLLPPKCWIPGQPASVVLHVRLVWPHKTEKLSPKCNENRGSIKPWKGAVGISKMTTNTFQVDVPPFWASSNFGFCSSERWFDSSDNELPAFLFRVSSISSDPIVSSAREASSLASPSCVVGTAQDMGFTETKGSNEKSEKFSEPSRAHTRTDGNHLT